MAIRCLAWLMSVAVLALLPGCGGGGESTAEPPLTEPPPLTAEQAKDAMIALLRSTELEYLHKFPVERFANEAVKVNNDGSVWWAVFSFDLKARKYSYSFHGGTPGTKSHFGAGFEGDFEFRQGNWVALKPRCQWII